MNDIQEFPKALYRGDELRIVADAAEEAAARDEGFAMAGEAAPEPAKRAKKA